MRTQDTDDDRDAETFDHRTCVTDADFREAFSLFEHYTMPGVPLLKLLQTVAGETGTTKDDLLARLRRGGPLALRFPDRYSPEAEGYTDCGQKIWNRSQTLTRE